MSAGLILVVSTNPAVDVEWRVADLRPEEKNEVQSEKRWPGGKGINVSRWLVRLGQRVELVLPLGGSTGREISQGLRKERIPFRPVPIAWTTRANVVVTTETRMQYRLNPVWPVLDKAELANLDEQVRSSMQRAKLMVISGALVRGAPTGLYASWIKAAHDLGLRVCLDCDGPAFRAGVRQRPFLVKPNLYELAQWAGSELRTPSDTHAALRRLVRTTRGWAVLSCGPDGAWMLGPKELTPTCLPAEQVIVRNTVGAGDAMLAGIVRGALHATDPVEWLRFGLATAARSIEREPG